MSEDDREYLRQHNIHVLLDVLAKDMIEKRPDNPQQFVVEWLKAREAAAMRAEGAADEASPKSRGKKPQLADVLITNGPECMSNAELHDILRESPEDVVVVDVRSEQIGGRITHSVHIPLETIQAEPEKYAEQWKDKKHVVFCSAVSPDIDQTAALPVMQALTDLTSEGPTVSILVGGLCQWLHAFGATSQSQDYDPEPWKKR